MLLSAGATSSAASDTYWQNASGGNWSNAANWTAGVPGSSDNAFIILAGTYTVTVDISTAVASLTVGASSGTQTVLKTSGTFTINGSAGSVVNPRGVLNLQNVTLTLSGDLSNAGNITFGNTTVNGSATLTNSPGATLTFNSYTAFNAHLINQGLTQVTGGYSGSAIGGTLVQATGAILRVIAGGSPGILYVPGFVNHGAVELTASFSHYTQLIVFSGTLTNSPSGEIRALGAAGGDRYLLGELDNQGRLNVNMNAGTRFILDKASAHHINSGTINLNSGYSMELRQSGTNPTFANMGGAVISVAGGNLIVNNTVGSALFTNAGSLTLGSGRTLSITGGTFNEDPGGSIGGPQSTISLSSATFNLGHDFSTASGAIALYGAALNGPGVLTNGGGKTIALYPGSYSSASVNTALINQGTVESNGGWTGAWLNGPFTQESGATLRVQATGGAPGILRLSGGFTNPGRVELTATHNHYVSLYVNSGKLTNAPSGEIRALAGAGGDRFLLGELDNQGTINVSVASGYRFSLDKASAHHINSGTINGNGWRMEIVQSGTAPSFANQGAISAAGGDVIIRNTVASAVFDNAGSLTLGPGRTLSVIGGTFNEQPSGVIGGPQSAITLSSERFSTTMIFNLGHDFDTANGTITLYDATVNGPGVLTNSPGKLLSIYPGRYAACGVNASLINRGTLQSNGTATHAFISGAFAQEVGSTLRLVAAADGAASLAIANGFTNHGLIEFTSVLDRNAILYLGSDLINAPGAEIRLAAGAGGGREIHGRVNNQGTVNVAAGSLLNAGAVQHLNSGTITVTTGNRLTVRGSGVSLVNSGTINLPGAVTLEAPVQFSQTTGRTTLSGGSITTSAPLNFQGGTLEGAGTVFGNVLNGGTVAPGTAEAAGALSITGTYAQTAAGRLRTKLGGLAAGTEYDRLAVGGVSALNGTLEVALTGGFVPATGNSFAVLTYGAGTTTTFSTIENHTDACLQPRYQPTSLSIDICACLPPVVTSQPVDASVCETRAALLTVAASGTEPFTYQWRKNGVDIPGAESASYSIASAAFGDAGNYDVRITNDCGQALSATATLAVHPVGPEIVQQPVGDSLCIGASAGFAVVATPRMGGALSYQWRKDGTPISGAIESTLSLVVMAPGDGGQYDCLVTEVDCGTTSSAPAMLAVRNDPPSITLQGASEVTLQCHVDGYTELGASVADDCDDNLTVAIGGDQVNTSQVGDYAIAYDAVDGQGNPAVRVIRVVRVRDTLPPELALNGDPSMVVECHSEYTDPGVSPSDLCDPNVTVAIGGDAVDPNTPGTYEVTYQAQDESGNPSLALSRTVLVRDTTPPALTLNGDAIVTVECHTSYSELGAAAADACDGELAVTIGGDVVDAATPGEYVVTYRAIDRSGNSAQTSRTVRVEDTIPPVLVVDDLTPIAVADTDCSGAEAVALPAATATDHCDAAPVVTNDAPAVFPAGSTTQVTYVATDAAGNWSSQVLDVTVQHGASVEILATKHTVGQGSHPSTSKEPLVGLTVYAYDASAGTCAERLAAPSSISWQDYPAIVANCTADGTAVTDAFGVARMGLSPGDYVLIGEVTPNQFVGVMAENVGCEDLLNKRLQLLAHADGRTRPGKTTRLTGSELLIIEPDFVIWDDTTQAYPFVFESIGDWGVTVSVTPPEGFAADHDTLTADVIDELEGLQFAITELGSDLVPARTAFDVTHRGQRHKVRSEVGILLSPEYAKARGFNVAALRARGLIAEHRSDGNARKVNPMGEAPDRGDEAAQPGDSGPKAVDGARATALLDTSSLAVEGDGLRAWPSPFTPGEMLHVAFRIPGGLDRIPADLDVSVFDVTGRRVATLSNASAHVGAGVVRMEWSDPPTEGFDGASGIYFLRVSAPSIELKLERSFLVIW